MFKCLKVSQWWIGRLCTVLFLKGGLASLHAVASCKFLLPKMPCYSYVKDLKQAVYMKYVERKNYIDKLADGLFPINLSKFQVEKDHTFLEQADLDSLIRRLNILNRCADVMESIRGKVMMNSIFRASCSSMEPGDTVLCRLVDRDSCPCTTHCANSPPLHAHTIWGYMHMLQLQLGT
jgi:hypothetical protein